MNQAHSVTELMEQLAEGESVAAKEIWDRFIQRLVGLARKHLQSLPRRAIDEEDVALSAFDAFFRGVKEQRFDRLDDREDLWQVLAMLAERKAIGAMRHELAAKRGGGVNRGESVFERMIVESSGVGGLQAVIDPGVEIVSAFASGVREEIESLPDEKMRRVVMLKLEGLGNREIATQIGISLRAVERKLHLVRQRWQKTV